MRTSFIAGFLLGAPLMIHATSESIRNCVVNSRMRDEWVENGLTRWRTVFSASGDTDVGMYCKYWTRPQQCVAGTLSYANVQCGWDGGVDGGSWRVDVSIPRGPVGDEDYWKCLKQTRDEWIWESGCRTG